MNDEYACMALVLGLCTLVIYLSGHILVKRYLAPYLHLCAIGGGSATITRILKVFSWIGGVIAWPIKRCAGSSAAMMAIFMVIILCALLLQGDGAEDVSTAIPEAPNAPMAALDSEVSVGGAFPFAMLHAVKRNVEIEAATFR